MKKYNADIAPTNKNNISFGAATIPYDAYNKAWVKIGGNKIDSRKKATEYARKLNRLIRASKSI